MDKLHKEFLPATHRKLFKFFKSLIAGAMERSFIYACDRLNVFSLSKSSQLQELSFLLVFIAPVRDNGNVFILNRKSIYLIRYAFEEVVRADIVKIFSSKMSLN